MANYLLRNVLNKHENKADEGTEPTSFFCTYPKANTEISVGFQVPTHN